MIKKKILFVASTMSHLANFHMPYINELKKTYDVFTMAKNDFGFEADFDIHFEKKDFLIKNIGIIKKIRKILKEYKFDVIFLNTTLAAFYVRCAVKGLKNKPKVVNIVHGYLFSKHVGAVKRFALELAEKFVAKQTDNIVTMNREDFEYAKKHKLSKGEVFFIDGMGVDNSRVRINQKERHDDKIVFTFIGELSARKNQKFLIKAVKALEKFDYNIELNLLGYGVKTQKFINYAKKLKVDKKVNFCGYQKDISKYLENTDFYVSASKIEGCPFNIIEAMMAGKVVFSADIKGAVDVISDLENGVLYKFGNLDSFVSKFRLVKNNLKLQEEIKKNAILTSKKYELDKVFSKNMNLFNNLIEKEINK